VMLGIAVGCVSRPRHFLIVREGLELARDCFGSPERLRLHRAATQQSGTFHGLTAGSKARLLGLRPSTLCREVNVENPFYVEPNSGSEDYPVLTLCPGTGVCSTEKSDLPR
jgi:hypothetical protein